MYNKYAILQMRRCENLKMCRYSMCKCENVQMCRYSMCKCENVQMCRYSMCKCENVQMELIDNTADYKASKIKIRPFIHPINILSH
jgi:hypothetical protein